MAAGAITVREQQQNVPLQCPKLTETNYSSWSVMVEAILQAYGLWEAVDPATEGPVEAKKNLMARAFVFQTLPEDVLLQVARYKDAKEVWKALKVRYLGAERVQKARLQTLRSELEMLKMKESESIDEFSGKLGGIVTKFKSLGSSLEDEVVVRKLLNSVPRKYLQIVASIEQYSDLEKMSLEEAIGRLKAYEERIKELDKKEEDQGKLLLSRGEEKERQKQGELGYDRTGRGRGLGNRDRCRGRGRGNGREDNGRGRCFGRGSFRDKSELKCYECGKYGHFAYECPNWYGKEEANLALAQEDDEPTLL